MLFNSLQFLLFFPIVTIIYFAIPQKWKSIWLLLTSYYFYMNWDPRYIILLLFDTAITYIGGIAIERALEKGNRRIAKLSLAGSACAVLGILFFYKYFNFALGYVNRIFEIFHIQPIKCFINYALPVGISFFTFQGLGYVIDVYRGKTHAEKNLKYYALFIAFFPQLVAGPIERSDKLLKQVRQEHGFNYDRVINGLLTMAWGFFLKLVIADRAAIVINTIYNDPVQYGGFYLIVATILFAFQIYCDFAGYTTIARGSARVMGFELMENFKSPYLAVSVSDFWRKWHISLSGWFRDYLYIPLGGNRKGNLRKYINLLFVFAVSGLWHGASMAYIIWGGLNGIYQIVGDLKDKAIEAFTRKMDIKRSDHIFLKRIFTFALIDFSWLFFRAGSIEQAKIVLQNIINTFNPWILLDGSLYQTGLNEKGFIVLLVAIAFLLFVDYMHNKEKHFLEVWGKWGVIKRSVAVTVLVYAVLLLGIYGVDYDVNTFIYFAF